VTAAAAAAAAARGVCGAVLRRIPVAHMPSLVPDPRVDPFPILEFEIYKAFCCSSEPKRLTQMRKMAQLEMRRSEQDGHDYLITVVEAVVSR
jgi:hypothetical protein